MNVKSNIKNELSSMQKILGIFFYPRKTFTSIDKKSNWLFPFIIIVAIETISIFSIRDIKIDDDIARMQALNQSQEKIERIMAQKESPVKYLIIPGALISMFLGLSIFALIFYFLGMALFKVDVNFNKVISILVWSTIINSIGTVIRTIIILFNGTTYGITTSMAMFLQPPLLGKRPSEIYLFLSKFDIFMLWKSVLLILGFSIIYRISIKKSACLILLLWLVWVIIFVFLIWGARIF